MVDYFTKKEEFTKKQLAEFTHEELEDMVLELQRDYKEIDNNWIKACEASRKANEKYCALKDMIKSIIVIID